MDSAAADAIPVVRFALIGSRESQISVLEAESHEAVEGSWLEVSSGYEGSRGPFIRLHPIRGAPQNNKGSAVPKQ